jgi:hypothetical protein
MHALATEIRDMLNGCSACPEGPEHVGTLAQITDELIEHIEDERHEMEPEEEQTDPSQVKLPCGE